jgi:hypothetical protein
VRSWPGRPSRSGSRRLDRRSASPGRGDGPSPARAPASPP